MKPLVFIFGSSHAAWLKRSVLANNKITSKYNILSEVKPGAKYLDLQFPTILDTFESNDILLIQLFGNNIMKRHTNVTWYNRVKTIHMFKFEPVNKEELLNIFEILNRKLQTLKCKVIILDNPIQHLFCCRKHIFKQLFCYQVACNRLLRYYFGHHTVINHRYLLQKQIKQKIIENMLTYFKIWFISNNIAQKMFERIVGPIAGTLTRAQ